MRVRDSDVVCYVIRPCISLLPQMKDDFLGRQFVHVDFGNIAQRLPVVRGLNRDSHFRIYYKCRPSKPCSVKYIAFHFFPKKNCLL